jgi:hypothetical protein
MKKIEMHLDIMPYMFGKSVDRNYEKMDFREEIPAV